MGVGGSRQKQGVHSTLLFVPLNCASLVCGTGGFCFTRIVRQTNSVQLRRTNKSALWTGGTGKFICHVKKYGVQSTPSCCAASAVAEAMAGQAASQARLPHGGICFTRIVRQTNSVQLRRTNKSALWAGGTGDCLPQGRTLRTGGKHAEGVREYSLWAYP